MTPGTELAARAVPLARESGTASVPLLERSAPGLHEWLLGRLPASLAKDAPILDVGCGTGAWLARLGAAGYSDLTGVDLDTAQVAFRQAAIFRSDLNAPEWDLPQREYALVTAIEVIEHLDNVGSLLANVRRRLADDGIALVTTPNVQSIGARLRFFLTGDMKHFGRIGDPTHVFPVLAATLERLAAARGLRVLDRWAFPPDGRPATSRPWVAAVCGLLRFVLPEPHAGDNACFVLARRRGAG